MNTPATSLPVLTRAYAAPAAKELDAAAPASLTNPPPAISPALAVSYVLKHFGISGAATALTSERDANVKLTLADGQKLLIKFANDQEDPSVTAMQTEALAHLAAVAPDLPVQRVYLDRDGEAHVTVYGEDGRKHIMRVVSFLDGTMMHAANPSPGFHGDLGHTLGKITHALRGFFHPMAGHSLPWDIKQAQSLTLHLPYIDDLALRKMVETVLDRFEVSTQGRIAQLRAQIVHNDLNPYNVVVDGPLARQVTGVIDFGDMVHTALACDLAVACSYHIEGAKESFDKIVRIVGAYHEVLPLEEEEVVLLPELIALRNVATIAITSWRAARFPENRAYILRNVPNSVRSLELITQTGTDRVAQILRDHLNLSNRARFP